MRRHLEDQARHLEITGYRDADSAKAEAYLKTRRTQSCSFEVQFFDADLIATYEHLYFAALNALEAFRGGTNISKSPAMEAMLYASARRQIQKAIARSGIKPETRNIAVLVIAESEDHLDCAVKEVSGNLGKEPDEAVLELTSDKLKRIQAVFGITKKELETTLPQEGEAKATVALIIERVALLATEL